MAEIGTVTAVFGAIKTAVNALKGLKDLGLSAKHAEAVDAALDVMRDAQDRLSAVHGELLDLREENYRLRRTLEDHDRRQERFDQYSLVRTPGSAQVYQNGEPPDEHYACPVCFERQEIQVLQRLAPASGLYDCPSCKASYSVLQPREYSRSSIEPDDF